MTIPDSYLFPYQPMDVAAYLRASHSPRADDLHDFPSWVEFAAEQYDLNPRWLLMLAEKEQSFLTRPNDGSPGWKRAYDWTLGFGATDGGDLKDKTLIGPKNQLYRAARGLRRYLTPGDSLCVLGMVGHEQSGTQGRFTPRTLAEAAAWQYTPWVRYLQDILEVWGALGKKAPAEWKGQMIQVAHGLGSTHPLTEAVLRALGVTDGQVTQGWGTTVTASAGSHDPVGECPAGRKYGLCVDLSYSLLSRPLFDRLAAHGVCMFPRTPGKNGWPKKEKAHIHCVHVGLRDHADAQRTVSLPLEQIDSWVRAHNGLISNATLPVAWRPNAPQERFIADRDVPWRAAKPVTVLSPEGHPIPCFAVVAHNTTRCEVRRFCDYWEAPLTWAGGKLSVTTGGHQLDITKLVTVEGDISRAGLRDLAAVIGLGIGEWHEEDYSAMVELVYK